MKDRIKKTISMLLIIIITTTSFITLSDSNVLAYSGSDYTSNTAIANKLTKIFNGEVALFSNTSDKFEVGDVISNSRKLYVAGEIYGWQCYIYAQAVYYYLFGDIPSHGSGVSGYWDNSQTVLKNQASASYSSFMNAGVTCGSYIRTTGNSDGTYSSSEGHSLIVLSYDSSRITTLEGNADGNGKIQIITRTWEDFNSKLLTKKGRRICHVVVPINGPTISITRTETNIYGFRIYFTVSDPSGIDSYYVYVNDDEKLRFWNGNETYTSESTFASYFTGENYVGTLTVRIVATNILGYSTTFIQNYSFDNRPPETPSTTPTPTSTPGPSVTPTSTPIPTATPAPSQGISTIPPATGNTVNRQEAQNFATRCYELVLDRTPDATGLNNWTNSLVNNQNTGAHMAYGFFFSQEYINSNTSNEEFVTTLYNVFLDRAPDQGGLNDWVGQLEAGVSREQVFAGVANSREFFGLCNGYGITAGHYVQGLDNTQQQNVNAFVARLYSMCLGRVGDYDGQANWVRQLINRQNSGAGVAYGFFFSQEFINRNLTNEEYVATLYRVFLGREPDQAGFNSWVSQLNNGADRLSIFRGFAHSQEYTNICSSYGIDRGSI